MSKAYPTREPDLPTIGKLVPTGTCPICKKRPAQPPGQYCDVCRKILEGSPSS